MVKIVLFLFLSNLCLCDFKSLKPIKEVLKNLQPTTKSFSTTEPSSKATSTVVTVTSNIFSTSSPKPKEKESPRKATLSDKEQEILIKKIFPSACGIEYSDLIPQPTHENRRRRKRVVGGEAVRRGQFPWQVALLYKGRHYCGGSIVHRSYIVTGAHCFNPHTSSKASDWTVRAGDHRLNDVDIFEVEVGVENITSHEHYVSMWFEGITDTPPKNDIAVLKLKHPLNLKTHYIQPICLLHPKITIPWGHNCSISGWGHLQWNGSQPNTMNFAQVPLVTHEVCNLAKAYNGTIHDTALCAGYSQGKTDACEYDSGGPLSCMRCGRYYLTGVTSWGHECARENKYGVYARMRVLTPWLIQKIAESESSKSKRFRSG